MTNFFRNGQIKVHCEIASDIRSRGGSPPLTSCGTKHPGHWPVIHFQN